MLTSIHTDAEGTHHELSLAVDLPEQVSVLAL